MLKPQRTRRGNAIIFGLCLVPLLGFSALAVDVGTQRMTENELRHATKAAALAGAGYLNGTQQGLFDAINGAVAVGNENGVYENFLVQTGDVELGTYADGEFMAVDIGNADPEVVNAVRVITGHTHGAILAPVISENFTTLDTNAASTAMRPTGGTARFVPCYLPFAIPACVFEADWLKLRQPNPLRFQLNKAGDDNVGWGLPIINPNTTAIKDQIAGQCDQGVAETGNTVNLSNGQNNSAVALIADIINQQHPTAPTDWPSEYFARPKRNGIEGNFKKDSDINSQHWGNNVSGVVPIIDAGYFGNGGNCGDLSFQHGAPIVGWTYTYIFDTQTQGGDKNLWMQFDFLNDYDIGYGYDSDAIGNILGTEAAMIVE